jgi:hypothetical protein
MVHMFYTYVASVLSGCCVCVAIVFTYFFQVFLQVFQTLVLIVSSVFRRIFQVLYLDISKVDQVLRLPPRFLLPHLGIFSSLSIVLHHSQTAEGVQRGPAKRVHRGQQMGHAGGL